MILRALIIGIDEYSQDPLTGCARDAELMAQALGANEDGSPNFDCILLTAPSASVNKSDVRDHVRALFEQPADAALFYFSGHGTADNLGGYLITQDAHSYEDGYPMSHLLELATQAKIPEIVLILDCCDSGSLGNAPAKGEANNTATIREGISILTASRNAQSAVEANGAGLFTSLVLAGLDGGAADILGRVTVPAIYSFVDQAMSAWNQRPLFKAHVARLMPIRRCTPSVTLDLLRKLPDYFPTIDAIHKLDPSYEPTEDPKGHANEKIFADLQNLRDARILVPVDATALYWAAVQKTGCALTPSGKYYWRLAKERRI